MLPGFRSTVLIAFALVLVGPPASGQDQQEADRLLREGIASLEAADTGAALSSFKKALERDPDLVAAYIWLGRAYTHRAGWIETDFADRERAEQALQRALEIDPDNPLALAELGHLKIKQHMKVDAGRLLKRALRRAEETGLQDPAALAEAHFNLGYVNEREYERLRDRYLIQPNRSEIAPGTAFPGTMLLEQAVDEYLRSTAPIEGSGETHKQLMLDHYKAALRYDRDHFDAHRRLMLHLLEDGHIGEYLLLARNLARAYPERPEAQLYLGMGYHQAGREDEAGEAFSRGLAGLPEEERRAFLDLDLTMRRKPGEDYRALGADERARFEEKFWRISDPLFLTEANERRLEHLSRVAYADLRFSEPATGKRGWETDRGTIYIRYGPPETVARAGPVIWRYGADGPSFMFDQTPGYNRSRFAGEYRFVARNYRAIRPSSYDRIPSIPVMLDMPVQIARFRGATPEELAVEIHARLPLERLARSADLEVGQIETGLFLLDRQGERVVEQTREEAVDYEEAEYRDDLRSWRLLLPAGGLLIAGVEAREVTSWASAAARDTFTALPFLEGDELQISDLLLADDVRPLRKEPKARFDYDIVPNPSLEFGPDQTLHLYWELYDLEQDAQGFASFDVSVEIRIEQLHREGVLPEILGGLADLWGFTVEGDDHLELRFNREIEVAGRDRITEYISLELKDAPVGEYEVRVRVWDRQAEKLAERKRSFVVQE